MAPLLELAADESLFVRHPTVYDVPRSFDMCLQEIYVKDAPRTVRFRANETALTCAARAVASGGGDPRTRSAHRALPRAPASMALMARREFRRALRWATSVERLPC